MFDKKAVLKVVKGIAFVIMMVVTVQATMWFIDPTLDLIEDILWKLLGSSDLYGFMTDIIECGLLIGYYKVTRFEWTIMNFIILYVKSHNFKLEVTAKA